MRTMPEQIGEHAVVFFFIPFRVHKHVNIKAKAGNVQEKAVVRHSGVHPPRAPGKECVHSGLGIFREARNARKVVARAKGQNAHHDARVYQHGGDFVHGAIPADGDDAALARLDRRARKRNGMAGMLAVNSFIGRARVRAAALPRAQNRAGRGPNRKQGLR